MSTLILLLCGMLLSCVTWQMMVWQMEFYHRTEFDWVAQTRNRVFQKGVSSAIDIIKTVGVILEEEDHDETNEFLHLSHHFLSDNPWLASLTWWQESGTVATVGQEDIDLQNSPLVQEGLARARTTQQMAINSISRESGGEYRLKSFIFLPVYKDHPLADNHAVRNLIGFVIGGIDVSRLANTSIGILEPRGVEFLLLDETLSTQSQFLEFYGSRLSPEHHLKITPSNWSSWLQQQKRIATERFPVADRIWSITCAATPYFRSAEGFPDAPFVVLITGLLLTLILTVLFYRTRNSLIERTQLYDELSRSEETLRVFFEQCPDIVLIVDRESVIRAVNRDLPLTKVLDTDGSPLVQGKCFLNFLPADLRNTYQTVVDTVLRTGQSCQFSHQTGKLIWWEIRIAPIHRKTGLIEAMVLFTNISEKRFVELKALRNARLASMGALAAGIAHEINNPNNAILFNASILRRSWQDALPVLQEHHQVAADFALGGVSFDRAVEAIPRLISGIASSSERIKKIVENVKQLARDDPGTMEHFINVEEVICTALTILEHQTIRYTDHLSTTVDTSNTADGLLLVYGNFQQLEQVVINLVINALQSLPDRSRSVSVTACCLDGMVQITVEDEGCGIDTKHQPFVFDPFFTTRMSSGGTGLGLSLAQEIVTNHKGNIHVRSKPGDGTIMIIMLPMDTKQEGRPSRSQHLPT
ncbi:MAG: PAS domain-containing protein [Magnetococcales bacterium]|nr:PAS domain-containing protein [Magnetococcales bacterium]